MRHINPWPSFTKEEQDDLRKKIVHGVICETYVASPIAHRLQAIEAGKVWPSYPCWISGVQWEDGKGFKKFKFKGHTLYIHRASCELWNGPVPKDYLVDHLCRVRGCCQPAHLEAVTTKENTLRGANQNHLLRKGEKPPCAKDVNPRIFEAPPAAEVDDEQRRRIREDRNGPARHWEAGKGPPPPAPAGFEWENIGGFGTISHILQPVRSIAADAPTAMQYDIAALAASLPAPQPHLEVPGPHREINPDWASGKVDGPIFHRVEIGRVPVHDAFDEQTKIMVAMAPVGPEDQHEDPFYLKMPPLRQESWLRRKWNAIRNWLDKPVINR